MSDFGDSIFDDRNPPPPPPRRREPRPAAPAAAPAVVEAVPLTVAGRVRDDLDDVVFAPAPAAKAPASKPAGKPESAPVSPAPANNRQPARAERRAPAAPPAGSEQPTVRPPEQAARPAQEWREHRQPARREQASRRQAQSGPNQSPAPAQAASPTDTARDRRDADRSSEPASRETPPDRRPWREHSAPAERSHRPGAHQAFPSHREGNATEPRQADRHAGRGSRDAETGPLRDPSMRRSGPHDGMQPRRDEARPRDRAAAPAAREHVSRDNSPREMGNHSPAARTRPAPGTVSAPRSEPHQAPRTATGHANAALPASPGRGEQAKGLTVLVDLAALQAEANQQGGELAQRRLLGGLAGGRDVEKALCLHAPSDKLPGGFTGIPMQEGVAAGVRLAALAFEAAAGGARILLAPASPPMRQLAQALSTAGFRVELASFTGEQVVDRAGGSALRGIPVRQLGRECLFVP